MDISFRRPTESDARIFVTWKYDGIYSFYNNDKTEAKKEWIETIYNDESAYTILNGTEVIGNCCFEYDEDEKEYEFGIQMRPDLTGKGNGVHYVSAAIEFGRNTYGFNTLVLLVADFNKRAYKLYSNLGFLKFDEFDTICNGEDTHFLVMRKTF